MIKAFGLQSLYSLNYERDSNDWRTKTQDSKPLLDAQCIEEMEITVAQSMETGSPLLFEVYDNGYIHEIKGSVHFVDHVRKEFRVKGSRSETNLVQFQSIVSVKTPLPFKERVYF
ncbi:YolD-like family protein [Bacillus velezensis]|nr:YolD-like family protein [Bacillus velezensis]